MPKYTRKAPAIHAGPLKAGTIMSNEQGVAYKVVPRIDGTNFWKECGTTYKGETVDCNSKMKTIKTKRAKSPRKGVKRTIKKKRGVKKGSKKTKKVNTPLRRSPRIAKMKM
jgi:hypothetical protein